MTLRAQLDSKTVLPDRRTAIRRKLHLCAERLTGSGTSDVLILDISTTGLLFETTGSLSVGETIELNIPGTNSVSAVVRWSDEQRFGCKFREPITAAVLNAILRRGPSRIHEEDAAARAMSAKREMIWLLAVAFITAAVLVAALWPLLS
jgi:hypothetical protein